MVIKIPKLKMEKDSLKEPRGSFFLFLK